MRRSDRRRPRAGCRRRAALPGAVSLHRGRRRAFLRPRGRGRGAVGEARAAEAARGDRALGSGQDLLPAGGGDPAPARGMGRGLADARARARRGLGRGAHAGARRRRRGPRGTDPGRLELVQTGSQRARRLRGLALEAAHGEALLVVDQFEELFTLNPPEAQAALRRAARPARGRGGRPRPAVAARRFPLPLPRLSRRSLRSSTMLTPLGPPSAEAPASGPGGARGAAGLALRGRGACGRDGRRGGGSARRAAAAGLRGLAPVGGAGPREEAPDPRGLRARSAVSREPSPSTPRPRCDEIGPERAGIVREIFRNLVTAEGTRAARSGRSCCRSSPSGRDGGRGSARRARGRAAADGVRRAATGTEGEPSRHRIEIVHESLLTHWPRLVRWQTQDADGALLRDQLRQAAQLWDERGRPEDLLWTGTSYQEYAPGGSATREGCRRSRKASRRRMTALAGRRRRRRRIAFARSSRRRWRSLSATSVALAPERDLAAEGGSRGARAEASKLLALGQRELETYPDGRPRLRVEEPRAGRHRGGPALRPPRLAAGPHDYRDSGRRARAGPETGSRGLQPERRMARPRRQPQAQLRHRDGRDPVLTDYTGHSSTIEWRFGPQGDILAPTRRDIRFGPSRKDASCAAPPSSAG